jgi:SAM-dependent methyltransferase
LPIAAETATVVCLLDVLEHLSEPVPTLREAARILRPGGRVIINVPAHPSLWSAADEVLGHARRYTTRTLRHDVERGELEIVWMSHVFSWLFVPVWLRRRFVPASGPQLGLDVDSVFIDRLSMLLTRIEWAIASRVPLPIGTSLLCVARRPTGEPKPSGAAIRS